MTLQYSRYLMRVVLDDTPNKLNQVNYKMKMLCLMSQGVRSVLSSIVFYIGSI